jgi:hypothetical protein
MAAEKIQDSASVTCSGRIRANDTGALIRSGTAYWIPPMKPMSEAITRKTRPAVANHRAVLRSPAIMREMKYSYPAPTAYDIYHAGKNGENIYYFLIKIIHSDK